MGFDLMVLFCLNNAEHLDFGLILLVSQEPEIVLHLAVRPKEYFLMLVLHQMQELQVGPYYLKSWKRHLLQLFQVAMA